MAQSPIYRNLPKKEHHKELRIAVSKVLDDMEPGTEFSSVDLYEKVQQLWPGKYFLDTVMRYARMYRRTKYICIDRANSIYQRVINEELEQ